LLPNKLEAGDAVAFRFENKLEDVLGCAVVEDPKRFGGCVELDGCEAPNRLDVGAAVAGIDPKLIPELEGCPMVLPNEKEVGAGCACGVDVPKVNEPLA
jgi:hypothetical protein